MAKRHINPKTLEDGPCHASSVAHCPFVGRMTPEEQEMYHYSTSDPEGRVKAELQIALSQKLKSVGSGVSKTPDSTTPLPATASEVKTKEHGRWALADGIVYPLTDCCGASGKGSGDGVVCRKCYKPVGDRFALAARVAQGDYRQALRAMMPDCNLSEGESHENCVDDVAAEIEYLMERYLREHQ